MYFQLKKKIEKKLQLRNCSITFASSGHSSLQACCNLINNQRKKGKKILITSYGFVSGVQACIQSNLEPYFIDVQEETLEMNYNEAENIIKKKPNEFLAILISSPFGYPLNIKKIYNRFFKYNISIIYDAADAILNTNKIFEKKNIFYCFSFHPTKSLPSNESGMIVANKKFEKSLQSILNFGIDIKTRKINFFGFNGKFSEYDAAILDANFNKFSLIKNKIRKINLIFIKNLFNKNVKTQKSFGKKWFSLKIVLRHQKKKYQEINKIFKKNKIEIFKPWIDMPIHNYKIFKKFKKTSLINTKNISDKIFAVPIHLDMKEKTVKKILSILNKSV